MRYQLQIITPLYDEEGFTGTTSRTMTELGTFESKRYADKLAHKMNGQPFDVDGPIYTVIEADNEITPRPEHREPAEEPEYYGCPAHATFGDRWLYRDDPEAMYL